MINYIISGLIALSLSVGGWLGINQYQQRNLSLGAFGDPFISRQLAIDPDNGECLTTDGTDNSWSTSCGSSGSSFGATTTNPFMASYFVATSTVFNSTFPYASTTAFTASVLASTTRLTATNGNIGALQVLANGNVGVASSSPATTLSVSGNIYMTGGFGIGKVNTIAGGIIFNRDSGDPFFVWSEDGTNIGQIRADGTRGGIYFSDTSGLNTYLQVDTSGTDAGNVGIATTSPYAVLSVVGSSGVVADKYHATNTNATSTFAGSLDAKRINISGTATSTAAQGWNITAGCYAINGTCVSGGGASLSGGTAGMLAAWTSASALTATGTPTFASFFATSTTATSTIMGDLRVEGIADFQTVIMGPPTFESLTNAILGTDSAGTVIATTAPTAAFFTATTTTATSTFAGFLSAARAHFTGSATNTAAQGWNITNGCFAVNGTCISGGAAAISGGTAGMLTSWVNGSTLTATSAPTAAYFYATSSTASVLPVIQSTTIQSGTGNLNLIAPAGSSVILDAGTSGEEGQLEFGANNFSYNTNAVTSSEANHFILNTTGLGIGTTSPYAKLSVVGPAVAQYFHATDTSATSTFQGSLTAGRIDASGNATNTAAQGWNITDGCYAVDGTCISGGSGSGTVDSGLLGQVAYYAANGTTVSGTSTLFIKSNSRVGINTTNPSAPLHIGGNITTAPPTLGMIPAAFIDGSVNAISGVVMGNANTGSLADFRFLIKDPTDHYIAFMQPSLNYSGSSIFGLQRSDTDFILNAGGTYRDIAIGTVSAGSVIFGVNNSEAMRVASTTKNIGIGTTSPYAALSVAGSTGVVANLFHATSTTATSTFAGSLTAGRLNSSGTATNTAARGWNITDGCYAIDGSCIGGSSQVSVTSTTTASDMATATLMLSPTSSHARLIISASTTAQVNLLIALDNMVNLYCSMSFSIANNGAEGTNRNCTTSAVNFNPFGGVDKHYITIDIVNPAAGAFRSGTYQNFMVADNFAGRSIESGSFYLASTTKASSINIGVNGAGLIDNGSTFILEEY